MIAPKKQTGFDENLTKLREVMGVMQHHDAATGTEKQHVANDYAHLLESAIQSCQQNIKESLNQLTTERNEMKRYRPPEYDASFQFDFYSCPNLNISSCDVSENSDRFVVTVYNPLAHSTYQNVRVPVIDNNYQVRDYRDVPVESQTLPVPNEILLLSYRVSKAPYELVFLATEIPPLGYKSYFIERKASSNRHPGVILVEKRQLIDSPIKEISDSKAVVIGNKYLNLTFDENGLLQSVSRNGVETKVRQNFFYYEGAIGDNKEFKNRSSGAYIFRPNITRTPDPVNLRPDIRIVTGPLVDEVHQVMDCEIFIQYHQCLIFCVFIFRNSMIGSVK